MSSNRVLPPFQTLWSFFSRWPIYIYYRHVKQTFFITFKSGANMILIYIDWWIITVVPSWVVWLAVVGVQWVIVVQPARIWREPIQHGLHSGFAVQPIRVKRKNVNKDQTPAPRYCSSVIAATLTRLCSTTRVPIAKEVGTVLLRCPLRRCLDFSCPWIPQHHFRAPGTFQTVNLDWTRRPDVSGSIYFYYWNRRDNCSYDYIIGHVLLKRPFRWKLINVTLTRVWTSENDWACAVLRSASTSY